MNKVEALTILERIRVLLAQGKSTYKIAKIVGCSRSKVMHIKKGRRNAGPPIQVRDLKLVKTDKLCRKCGEACGYAAVAHGLICIKCTIGELIVKGLVKLYTYQESKHKNGKEHDDD